MKGNCIRGKISFAASVLVGSDAAAMYSLKIPSSIISSVIAVLACYRKNLGPVLLMAVREV